MAVGVSFNVQHPLRKRDTRKVAGSIPEGDHLNFSLTQLFRPHYGPGVDSASNRNKYPGSSLRDKGGRCVGLKTLPPSCADCLEILEALAS
jgi:hypothetical protein